MRMVMRVAEGSSSGIENLRQRADVAVRLIRKCSLVRSSTGDTTATLATQAYIVWARKRVVRVVSQFSGAILGLTAASQ